MSAREFGEAWALSQLSPGVHLVALAGLIGRRAAGWRGVVAAVAGMMVPAAAITVALTAAYGVIAASPIARAALAGVAPVHRRDDDRDRGASRPRVGATAIVIAIGAATGLAFGR